MKDHLHVSELSDSLMMQHPVGFALHHWFICMPGETSTNNITAAQELCYSSPEKIDAPQMTRLALDMSK